MRIVLVVAAGGAIGAVCRYIVSDFVHRRFPSEFPWGTLIVNVAGCFLIGLLLEASDHLEWFSPNVRALLVTGFLGAFTTFSTFGYETMRSSHTELTIAVTNVFANVGFGVGAVLLGMSLARFLPGA